MRFTIVTCTLNSERYLPQTIASVAAQEFGDYEHLFVDGGSTDGTLALIARIGPRARVVQQAAGGIARAMNAGIEEARGDVVMHLHSDDYLAHPRVLGRVAGHFDKSDCEWLYGRTLSDVGGGWTPETPDFPAYSYARLLRGNIVPHPATFVRRSLYRAVGGFDGGLRYAMDYDMWLRIGRRSSPLQLREFLSVFRAHAGSTTYANRLASFDEDAAVRRRHEAPTWSVARFAQRLREARRRRVLAAAVDAGSRPPP